MRVFIVCICLFNYYLAFGQEKIILEKQNRRKTQLNLKNKIVFASFKHRIKEQIRITKLTDSFLYFYKKVSIAEQNRIGKSIYCFKCEDKLNNDSLYNSLIFIIPDSVKICDIKKFQINYYKEKPMLATELLSYPVGLVWTGIAYNYIANAQYFTLKGNAIMWGSGSVLFYLYYKTFRYNVKLSKWQFKA